MQSILLNRRRQAKGPGIKTAGSLTGNTQRKSPYKISIYFAYKTKHKKAWHFDTPEKISTLMYFIKILLQNITFQIYYTD